MVKAVIMAGGKGTRLGALTREVPKPMVEVAGKPILLRQIENLKAYGIAEIYLVISYLGNVIEDYFGDGKKFGVSIKYINEKEPLGTGGALYYLKDLIDDDFVFMMGDLIEDVNFERMIRFHKNRNSLITLFAHPNSHPFDSDLIKIDDDNKVIDIDSKNNVRDYYYSNLVNAGIFVVSNRILEGFSELKKCGFESDVLKPNIKNNGVFAYISGEYVKDAGTPDRLESVSNDIKNGIVSSKNYSQLQKAIFLDRDGTINAVKGHLSNINDFELLPGVCEAIKKINNSEYLAIVITNQPVISRGALTFEGLKDIHNKMETLLGKEGAYLNGIYFCPHYPESGFEGEVKELKIDCDCRKPKIGMLLKAKERFNLDLSQCIFIGDSKLDVQCGKNGGCKTIYLGESNDYDADYVCSNLLEATKILNL